jgi:hypothetical protein
MSLGHSPRIVTDGLLNHYDFANLKSYPGSGNTLFDLTKKTNLTIAGSPTFNASGYLTFAQGQTTQYVYNSSFPMPADDGTISVWFRIGTTLSTQQTPISYNVVGNDNVVLLIMTLTVISPVGINDNTWDITAPVSSLQFLWCNMVWTRIKSTGVENFYLNGSLIDTRIRSIGIARATPGYLVLGQEQDSVGGSFSTDQNLDGDLACFSVYNRAITSTEVLQNFNALRGRYNI